MAYFENSRAHALRELNQNSLSRFVQIYGQYKIENPKNPLVSKSIFTEAESQCFRMNTYSDENDNNDEDIH